jgi:hypothetical protein
MMAADVAKLLAEKAKDLGLVEGAEATIRASLAAARFAESTYLAMAAGAPKYVTAARFLAPTKVLQERTERRLRRELRCVLARLSRVMTMEELTRLADYVAAVAC